MGAYINSTTELFFLVFFPFPIFTSGVNRSIQSKLSDQNATPTKVSRENGKNSESDKQEDSSSSDQVSENIYLFIYRIAVKITKFTISFKFTGIRRNNGVEMNTNEYIIWRSV